MKMVDTVGSTVDSMFVKESFVFMGNGPWSNLSFLGCIFILCERIRWVWQNGRGLGMEC